MTEEPEKPRFNRRRKITRPIINEPSSEAESNAPSQSPEENISAAPSGVEQPTGSDQNLQNPSEPDSQKPSGEEVAKSAENSTGADTGSSKDEKVSETAETEKKVVFGSSGPQPESFEDFTQAAEQATPEAEPTYEEKRARRSRNPLRRKVSRDLMQDILEIERTMGQGQEEPESKRVSRRSRTRSGSISGQRSRSKDLSSTMPASTEGQKNNAVIQKIFGRIRDVSGVLALKSRNLFSTQKSKDLETTIKPPSPFLKISLKLFREYFQARESKFSKLEDNLRKAKMPYSSVQYLSLATFVSLMMAAVGGILISFFAYLLGPFYILAIAAGVLAIMSFIGVFLSLPSSTAKKRKKDIESKLPMALGYIATMASADMPVDQILFELGESPEYGAVAKEAKSISLATRVFGKDIISALRDGAKYSPSAKLAEFLQGIVTTVTSGGNLKQYFKTKAVQYQGELSTLIRANGESIGILAESYVTVGVAFPLMLIVILGVVASLQASSSGMIIVLYLIDLLIIPLITGAFAFLVSSTIKEIKV